MATTLKDPSPAQLMVAVERLAEASGNMVAITHLTTGLSGAASIEKGLHDLEKFTHVCGLRVVALRQTLRKVCNYVLAELNNYEAKDN